MRPIFAITPIIEHAMSSVTSLIERDKGIPGLALIFGPPGLGKTRFGIWLADKLGAVFVRALANATVRSFLQDLVFGLEPMYRASDIYKQAERSLSENPRLIIIDEVDRIVARWQAIEALRDLSDQTSSPILLIGMEESERKLVKFRHLFYRMKSHIMRFTPLSEADVRGFVDQVCEVQLEDSAIAEIHKITGGRIGDIIAELYKAERIARANDLKTVEGSHLRRRAA
jgi:DNA polymerase III delta prime subunit